MSGKQQPRTHSGLRLVRAGVPLRTAALVVGVAVSTLQRAAAREGIVLKRGRKPQACRKLRGDEKEGD